MRCPNEDLRRDVSLLSSPRCIATAVISPLLSLRQPRDLSQTLKNNHAQTIKT